MDFKLRKFYGFSSMGPVTFANAEAACAADGLPLATTISPALDVQGAALFAGEWVIVGWSINAKKSCKSVTFCPEAFIYLSLSIYSTPSGFSFLPAGRSEGGWLSLENPSQGECNSKASCSSVLSAFGGGSPALSIFSFGFNVTNSSACVTLDPGGNVVSAACNSTHQAICDSGGFCHAYYSKLSQQASNVHPQLV